jgi:hypothetical protein
MTLEHHRVLFITFDFLPCREKFLAPRVFITRRPLIDNAADTEPVVALVADALGGSFPHLGHDSKDSLSAAR